MKGDPVTIHMPGIVYYEGDGYAAVKNGGALIHMVPEQYLIRSSCSEPS